MADYESSTEIQADPDSVFDYLSDIANLPRYFDRMTDAEPGTGEEVHVAAQLDDQKVEGNAWFHVDRSEHTLEWGSEGPDDYHGRLTVSERGTGARVAVVLSTERAAGPEIQDGLDQTLDNIQRLVEAG